MRGTYENGTVLLVPLSDKDSKAFYGIYNQPDFWEAGSNTVFLHDETPEAFTRRILSLCDRIFTIRLANDKDAIIGDCALHHWNREANEIEIGGSLFNEYRGKGYMRRSFEVLLNIAEKEMDIKTVVGKTSPDNKYAIALAEKMGFKKVAEDSGHVILKRH